MELDKCKDCGYTEDKQHADYCEGVFVSQYRDSDYSDVYYLCSECAYNRAEAATDDFYI